MIAVIPVAGLGTRLLPSTKEQPKEMLPVFARNSSGTISLKPTIQIIFEQLFESGIRNFLFVIGRGKRIIEDHFTPDRGYLELLVKRGKITKAEELKQFYNMIGSSFIAWVNQDEPLGFGDAVLRSKHLVVNSEFMVHAGDTLILSCRNHIVALIECFKDMHADAVFYVKEVDDPRKYGVVIPAEKSGIGDVFKVKGVIEKPEVPPTNLAILPIYVFKPLIFKALESIEPSSRGELELTDAIQKLIDWGCNVFARKIPNGALWIDIGTPETYWIALKKTYELAKH